MGKLPFLILAISGTYSPAFAGVKKGNVRTTASEVGKGIGSREEAVAATLKSAEFKLALKHSQAASKVLTEINVEAGEDDKPSARGGSQKYYHLYFNYADPSESKKSCGLSVEITEQNGIVVDAFECNRN